MQVWTGCSSEHIIVTFFNLISYKQKPLILPVLLLSILHPAIPLFFSILNWMKHLRSPYWLHMGVTKLQKSVMLVEFSFAKNKISSMTAGNNTRPTNLAKTSQTIQISEAKCKIASAIP